MATGRTEDSKFKRGEKTKIATWNLQGGIKDNINCDTLIEDMEKYKIQIACLQETRCRNKNYDNDKGKIICFESDENTQPHSRYGTGFYICKAWIPHIWSFKYISDRISVIIFRLNKIGQRPVKMTIINVYAPTSVLVDRDENIANSFYEIMRY
jgi:exonuclease III